jgi:hypothetical protein
VGEHVERDEVKHPDVMNSTDIWEASPEKQKQAIRQFLESSKPSIWRPGKEE